MGLTDAPKQVNITDIYPEGTPFVIEKAWVEGVVPTSYGDRTMAKALVRPLGGGTPQEFALWGSLCEQVSQIEEGDVPGVYKIVKDGKRWLFASAQHEAEALAKAQAAGGESEPGEGGGAAGQLQAQAEGERVPGAAPPEAAPSQASPPTPPQAQQG